MAGIVFDRRITTEQARELSEGQGPVDLNTSLSRSEAHRALAEDIVSETARSISQRSTPSSVDRTLSRLLGEKADSTASGSLATLAGQTARRELAPELGIQEAEWIALEVEDRARFRDQGEETSSQDPVKAKEEAENGPTRPPRHITDRVVLGPNTDPWDGANLDNPLSKQLRELEAAQGKQEDLSLADKSTTLKADVAEADPLSRLNIPAQGLALRNSAQQELLRQRSSSADLILAA